MFEFLLKYLWILIVIGVLVFLYFKFADRLGISFGSKFKGRQEIDRVVYDESDKRIRLIGTAIKNKYLYYGLQQLGKIKSMVKIPYSSIKIEKYEDQDLQKKKKKIVTNTWVYYIKINSGFLGLFDKIFLINEQFLKNQSNNYIIDNLVSLENWGDKFWYSKEPLAQAEVEGIAWKENYKNVLALVQSFPEQVIKFEPQTAKETTVIKEQFEGMQRLKEGRRTKF